MALAGDRVIEADLGEDVLQIGDLDRGGEVTSTLGAPLLRLTRAGGAIELDAEVRGTS